MADAFGDAHTTVEDSRRRLLEAVAHRGSAGRQEFEQAEAALRAEREAAVRAAMVDAARRGAPAELQQIAGDRIGQVYDRRLSDIGQARGDLERRLADMQTSGQQYFDQAAGAIPVIRAQAEREAAERAAAAAEKRARSAASEKSPIELLKKELGTIDNVNKYLLDQSKSFVADAKRAASANKGAAPWGLGGPGSFTADDAYDKFDEQLGLPKGYTKSLARAKERGGTETERSRAQAARIKKLPQYRKILREAMALLDVEDITKTQVRRALVADYGARNPNTLALILKELGL